MNIDFEILFLALILTFVLMRLFPSFFEGGKVEEEVEFQIAAVSRDELKEFVTDNPDYQPLEQLKSSLLTNPATAKHGMRLTQEAHEWMSQHPNHVCYVRMDVD